MSNRLSDINDLENKIFEEYIDVIEGREPEKIKTENGIFDNRRWLEAEAGQICKERERIQESMKLNGGTADIDE